MSGLEISWLRSTSPINESLTIDAEASFFKSTYLKHSPFAWQDVELHSENGEIGWGKTVKFRIEEHGDLAGQMYLYLNISRMKYGLLSDDEIIRAVPSDLIPVNKIESIDTTHDDFLPYWISDLGYVAVKEARLKFGNYTAEYLTGDFMHVWDSLTRNTERSYVKNLPQGHGGKANSGTMHDQHVYIPMQFYFNRDYANFLPVKACPYTNIFIEVDFKKRPARKDITHFKNVNYTPEGSGSTPEQMYGLLKQKYPTWTYEANPIGSSTAIKINHTVNAEDQSVFDFTINGIRVSQNSDSEMELYEKYVPLDQKTPVLISASSAAGYNLERVSLKFGNTSTGPLAKQNLSSENDHFKVSKSIYIFKADNGVLDELDNEMNIDAKNGSVSGITIEADPEAIAQFTYDGTVHDPKIAVNPGANERLNNKPSANGAGQGYILTPLVHFIDCVVDVTMSKSIAAFTPKAGDISLLDNAGTNASIVARQISLGVDRPSSIIKKDQNASFIGPDTLYANTQSHSFVTNAATNPGQDPDEYTFGERGGVFTPNGSFNTTSNPYDKLREFLIDSTASKYDQYTDMNFFHTVSFIGFMRKYAGSSKISGKASADSLATLNLANLTYHSP